jgi:hypothetical protein
MRHHKPENNFLIANKKLEKLSSHCRQLWESRAVTAEESRIKQFKMKQHRLLAYSVKWDVIRSKRAELLAI